jgi:hypothetical protein
MQKLGHRLEVASASAAAAGSSEPASAKAAGTDPQPPPGGRVTSMHHNRRHCLVDPPGPRHLRTRFFGRGSNVSARPLLASPEAVRLLLDEVDDGLVAIRWQCLRPRLTNGTAAEPTLVNTR